MITDAASKPSREGRKKSRELGWRLEARDWGCRGGEEDEGAQCWGVGVLVCRESRGGSRDKGKEQGKGLVEAGKDGPGSGLLRRQTLMIWSPGPAHTPVFLS